MLEDILDKNGEVNIDELAKRIRAMPLFGPVSPDNLVELVKASG